MKDCLYSRNCTYRRTDHESSEKPKKPSCGKTLQRYLGFVDLSLQYIIKLADKLVSLCLLLIKDLPFKYTKKDKNSVFEAIECLFET